MRKNYFKRLDEAKDYVSKKTELGRKPLDWYVIGKDKKGNKDYIMYVQAKLRGEAERIGRAQCKKLGLEFSFVKLI